MDIDRFDGEFRFLSNFYPSDVTFMGMQFPTVEHAYQAAKCKRPEDYARFQHRACPSPGLAKRLGMMVDLRRDWDAVKLEVMIDLLQQKFAAEPLCSQLLATAPFHLTEGNTWGDTFWGVCNGRGQNHLGKMLMEIRTRLKQGEL